VIGIFWFLFSRSLVNRMRRRIARLREPRYVLPFLLGIGWIVYWGSRAFGNGGMVRVMSPGGGAMGEEARAAIALAGTLFLFAWTALLWLIPTKRAALEFTPAEIHFLFTAPITRRQIVHYKLIKAQIGILFGAFVTAFLWGRMWSIGGWRRLAGFWLLYALLHLHALGAGFVRTGLIEQGVSGLRRRVVPIALLLVFVALAVVGLRAAWPSLVVAWNGMWVGPPGDPDLSTSGAREFLRIVVTLGTTGVLGALLWPFSIMPHAVLAPDLPTFALWFGVGVLVLVLHYFWVVSAETAFEEASVEAAQKRAARVAWAREVRRRGGAVVKKARPFFWRLAPRGRPEVAIVWKNLVSMTRVVPVRAMIALVSIVFAMIAWTVGLSESRATLGVVIGLLLPQLALFFAVLGPLFVRNDLREDVFRLDALKTIPVAGHAIVWGEILAPTLVLATLEVVAIVAGMIVLAMSGTSAIGTFTRAWWISIGVSAALVLPALSLASVALQNALVLLFPAWVSVGNSRARGFEASGQRLLTLFGTVVFLSLIGLPAAVAGGVLSWLLLAPLGALCLVPGALVASAWIVVEIAIACRALGKLFDKLDPSSAGIEPREAS
jgi:hypothetical protein